MNVQIQIPVEDMNLTAVPHASYAISGANCDCGRL